MPRGGRRPGAGAPRGNTNNMKHGLYQSERRIRAIIRKLRAEQEVELLRFPQIELRQLHPDPVFRPLHFKEN